MLPKTLPTTSGNARHANRGEPGNKLRERRGKWQEDRPKKSVAQPGQLGQSVGGAREYGRRNEDQARGHQVSNRSAACAQLPLH